MGRLKPSSPAKALIPLGSWIEELDSGMNPAEAVHRRGKRKETKKVRIAATTGIPKMIRRCRETTQA